MKDYYAILQIRRFAGIAEVRRSYRMLVQQYHPDVNSEPSAGLMIREINEAYEILGDINKKVDYDNLLVSPYHNKQQNTAPQSSHRDPRYRPAKQPLKKENRQLELIKEYVHLAIKVSWAGCTLCVFLLADYCFTRHVIPDTVSALYTHSAGRVSTHYLTSASGRQIKIKLEDMHALERGRPIEIIESGITSTTLEIYFPEKDYHITSLATIYRNYAFVPIILLITSVLCLLVKNKIEFRFNLGIVSFFLLIFAIILLLK